nr:hypothetical protein GCM10020093_046170 [Planobispora longispora]
MRGRVRRGRRLQGGVGPQDREVDRGQLGGRVGAELLGEPSAAVVEDGERVGLPPEPYSARMS